ncbi:hypothetical protein [Streptomyces pseudovenezuelae]|uniref:hypothetical protein n=1 Tax=Streptomyces pseudovenezuelae TaxID=67350 RepID=UPI002E8123D5|nr:hypothetical protein [Streptomyces pseudovenezuelae]WUA85922.1 hypothetical protein OHO81_00790 [Streptomyces pseudovenezuelae]
MKELVELRLVALEIACLLDSFRGLVGLEVLSLYRNRLASAPHWLPELSELRNLNPADNELTALSPGLHGLSPKSIESSLSVPK